MTSKLNVAIIGAGRIGQVHAKTILNTLPEARIKYIADNNPAAQQWVESLGGPQFTLTPGDIFQDKEIDAVLICSSTDTHVEYIIEAANAGKHVFCEKPIDHDLSKIHSALEAVEQNEVKFQIGFNRRFDHNFSAVKQAIEAGQVGELRFINITSRDPGAPPVDYIKVSGGIFMDMTIHDFDMARYLACSEVTEVYAKGAMMVDPEIGKAGDYDSAAIMLTFANGCIAMINNCREASYGYDQRVEVFGSLGAMEIENDTPSKARLSTASGVNQEKPLHFFMDRYTQSYMSEIHEFIQAITQNRKLTTCAADGLKSVEIAKAALQSAKEGRPIPMK
ncbi:inositol 2-dehydrogenase [Dongshaea marina]|uniref:inositol 2-dehydrogenase n=1 Tax=Dongshaea marina TaxID=2047966 RepID=UPI000D3E732B|nr:inositol 2-dehydrogenase [Dongshaea marina]